MNPKFSFQSSIVLEENTGAYWYLYFSDPRAADGYLGGETIHVEEVLADALVDELGFESKTAEIDVFADFRKKLRTAIADTYHTSIDKVVFIA